LKCDDGNSNDGPQGARDNVKSDVENLIGGSGNDTLFANDGVADIAIGDGGATDSAHVDSGVDPPTTGCESVGP
jgi:hypothetical protein